VKKNGNRLKNITALTLSMKPYSMEMLLTIFSSLLKHLSMIGAVALTSYMVGLAMRGGLKERFPALFAVLLVCVILRATLNYGEMWFGHDVAFRAIRDFRLALYNKIDEISPAYLLREKTGNLGQTLVGDVEVLELFMAHTFGAFIVAIIVTVVILAVLLAFSPILAGMMLIFAVILGTVPNIMKKKADAQGYDVRECSAAANSITIEGIQGLRELLTNNAAERYKERNAESMSRLYDAQLRYGRRQGMESLLSQISVGCFTVAVMGITAGLVTNHTIGFELYPVTVMLAAMLFAPILEVANISQSLGLVFASANRIQNVLSLSPTVRYSGTGEPGERHDIAFEHVTFRYDDNAETVLRDVSFELPQGKTIALVGRSGAGKTTCANLLLRYWDAEDGSIKIGGRDIRELPQDSLRSLVAAVPQDTYLFHISVRDNIRLGKPDATDAEVEAASRAARAHGFISDLPNGYDTVTGERGFSLSGGQRQRIAIARVLLKGSPIVIFDEAVSNLDTENERLIQETLKSPLSDKTVLVIAHRLSTIMAADKIIVLENGHVTQTGTHNELISKDGCYRSLILPQITCETNASY
jgi:ABC-type multidrug transport system fused ATPase/permease subunit